MKDFFKKNWFLSLIGIFIFANVVFMAYNFVITKQKRNEYQKLIDELKQSNQISNRRQFVPNTNINFYDLPCPEISEYSISGEKIDLRNLIGNVILIRFSRFYMQDLAHLVYLQHLADKYYDQGTSLIFINSLGKHDKESIDKIINLTNPIIEDDGSIAALFNAFPEDLIIIDRNFTIKFKYHLAPKPLIYSEIMKWMFKEQPKPAPLSDIGLAKILQDLTFYDVFEKEAIKIGQLLKKKNIILTIFTSTCTSCEENYRVHHLKELSKKIDLDRVEIILLFGKGNNKEAIKKYVIATDLSEFPITVGVIDKLYDLSKMEYYSIFQLDTDPKTFIISSSGTISFAETQRTSKKISSDFLKKQL